MNYSMSKSLESLKMLYPNNQFFWDYIIMKVEWYQILVVGIIMVLFYLNNKKTENFKQEKLLNRI